MDYYYLKNSRNIGKCDRTLSTFLIDWEDLIMVIQATWILRQTVSLLIEVAS